MMKPAVYAGLAALAIAGGCYGGTTEVGAADLTVEQRFTENPEDFPPWLLPYIRTTALLASVLVSDSHPLPPKEIEAAVREQCECMVENGVGFERLVNLVNAQFALHQANLELNSAMACGQAGGKSAAMMNEDIPHCGNEPRPPFPPRWWDLIELQAHYYLELTPEYFDLTREQSAVLENNINVQLESLSQFQEEPCR